MGNHHEEYPGLDRTRLRDGYKRCIENAVRLIDDAALLKEARRLRSACLIVHMAVNELGNAMLLYEAGRSGVQNWEEWWNSYFARHAEAEETGEEPGEIPQGLTHVGFDRKDETFRPPREDGDGELLELFDKEEAYAQSTLAVLPPYGFELIELREVVQQAPEIALSVLYAWIEEVMAGEPAINERDLLAAAAGDMGMSPDDAADGFTKWKEVAPKLRASLDLLQRLQGRLKQKEGGDKAAPKIGAYMNLLRRVQGRLKQKQEGEEA